MQPVRLSFVFYDIISKWISHRHSCNVYKRSLCGIATAARPRTATHDNAASCRVGYFIPLNGPLNGHPPSWYYVRSIHEQCFTNETYNKNLSMGARRTLSHCVIVTIIRGGATWNAHKNANGGQRNIMILGAMHFVTRLAFLTTRFETAAAGMHLTGHSTSKIHDRLSINNDNA